MEGRERCEPCRTVRDILGDKEKWKPILAWNMGLCSAYYEWNREKALIKACSWADHLRKYEHLEAWAQGPSVERVWVIGKSS